VVGKLRCQEPEWRGAAEGKTEAKRAVLILYFITFSSFQITCQLSF